MFRKTYSFCCMSFYDNIKSCICCKCCTDQFPYPKIFIDSPSPLPNPWQPLTCFFNHWLPFSRITYMCNCICNVLVLVLYLRYIHLLCESAVCPFHWGVSVSLYGGAIICLLFHQLEDIWVVSSFLLLQINSHRGFCVDICFHFP